jgi:hypothetical protein
MMLLYGSDSARERAIQSLINDGVRSGKRVVYASIRSATPRIPRLDRAKPVQDCFVVFDIERPYRHFMQGDLESFSDLKSKLEVAAKEAADVRRDVIVVLDCGENFARDGKFSECFEFENWWQDRHFEWLERGVGITVVCPHPRQPSRNKSYVEHLQRISHLHSLIVSAAD